MKTDKVLELNYEQSLCDEIVSIKRQMKEDEERLKVLQNELQLLRPEGGKRYGVAMTEKERKGSMNLPWLAMHVGMTEEELDAFRKPGVKYWEFRNY